MKQPEFITVQDLYAYAMQHNLLDARIRICDGMAVSYYPDPRSVSKGRYEAVIDVSALERERMHRMTGVSLPETIFCIRT